MARTRSYEGISAKVWERLKARTINEHGTRYEPPNANVGLSRTGTVLGPLVLAFEFQPAIQHLTYTIREKPLLVSEGAIWSGIGNAIERCRS
jgi:hypothetical protein